MNKTEPIGVTAFMEVLNCLFSIEKWIVNAQYVPLYVSKVFLLFIGGFVIFLLKSDSPYMASDSGFS